ncbi:hypothetical protein Taro_046985 [Colocasia esculenta]|uniref:Uncharacterized protein n=1 Tax=Colocasia esculenta TaxID=4460 RepID=A0A843WTZ2_COLES|nr:hypothetical protein [Colocasia esculenta]
MSESAAAAGEKGCGGGIGGKFRRRPLRRAPATPYDRPPTAARGIRGNPVEAAAAAAGRNGWLSKLVDPASRLITRGATRFFSSVFQKRLGPPPVPELGFLLGRICMTY